MQNKPIFFDCDLGRFQLVVVSVEERIALGKFSCDLCDFGTEAGCALISYGEDCEHWDDALKDFNSLASIFWHKVLPTSTSAKTPRAERGTIGKEVI